jgi:hypothetical protein
MDMRMLLIASLMGITVMAGGAPAEAAGIGAVFRPAETAPSALIRVRRVGRGVGGVARRAAPVVGRIARAAGKLL